MRAIKALGAQKALGLGSSIDNNKVPVYYAVNDGDTLQEIANTFNLYEENIKKINGLKDNTIYSGQILYLKQPEQSKKQNYSQKNHFNNIQPFKVQDSRNSSIKNSLPESLIQNKTNEWEEYEYRETLCCYFGFTENRKLSDNLFHCLTAVTLILEHQAFTPDGDNILPKIPKKNWTNFYTFYFNSDGYLVLGEKNTYIYTTQVQNVGSGAYANEEKIISPIDRLSSKLVTTHNDLFEKNIIKFDDDTVFLLTEENNKPFYKVLQSVSIFNRLTGINYIYSLIKDEKDKVAKIIGIGNLISLPFEIPKIVTLQKFIGVIFYLIGLEQLIESFGEDDSEYKGPIMLSPINYYQYERKNFASGNDQQVLVSSESSNSYNIWESYQSIGLIKK